MKSKDLVQMIGMSIPIKLEEEILSKIKDGLGDQEVEFVWFHDSQRKKDPSNFTYFYQKHYTNYTNLLVLINGLIQSNT